MLAKVDDTLIIAEAVAAPEQAVTLALGEATVYLPLAGLIDLAAEKKRLSDELAAMETQMVKSDALLNSDFGKRAPTAVIDKERAKLADLQAKAAQVRERFGNEVKIEPIPGASAVIAALSASGFPSSEFVFLGFLPHKKGRETLFKEIASSKRTIVFYESPHRIGKTLASLALHFEPERRLMVSRELTKIYEENVHGTIIEVVTHFKTNPDKIRGEFVVVVEGL